MSTDLSTTYLGMTLKNPIVASAGPLTGNLDALRQLEDSGIAAVVLPSLFEEQIEHDEAQIDRLYQYQADSYAESLSYFPETENYSKGPQEYLDLIEEAKNALSVPVIASLNGHTPGGWTRYAQMLVDAGADALELNVYFVPTDCGMDSQDVEQRYVDLVASVRQSINIPLAVKIGSQFTSIPNIAYRLMTVGADGLVLFNRFLEPDLDLETLEIIPDLVLSQPYEVRLPLRWIAILRDQLQCSLAATSGIHHAADVSRVLLVGADVAMLTTALLKKGPRHVETILTELSSWLSENEYVSVDQLKGSMSRANCPDPSALERANYMKALTTYTKEYWYP
ncbi:dihydroorotate dehydrogenase-like protein [Bythopirellula polymerisocia]|uniref:NAD-dependent dihydropyrimidine dehydrogenase subunit PreA n=1 Tax=Bythopirellula polymerisocia TaxID=2528003 RepID=A0A5C6CYQ2_9BACT|nr:dihydroorotate dehydrogenase-like protein [Bythopirellula polymerisocia]TWU29752.1 NAD-dependent dihydropyrimidine dehydrogenase subunit PreA [Bythopirellula polymerisocia]